MTDHRGVPEEIRSDQDFFIYHHGDHLGSSHILTEGKPESRHSGVVYRRGQLLQRFEYSPFGQETYVLNPNLQFDPSYTGQIYDIESGLYYYKSRYYNPELGRFIQPDTVVPDAKNLQAYNRYTYVNNNPLKYVDPTGHFWGLFRKIVGAFVGGAIMGAFSVMMPGVGILIGGLLGGVVAGAISGGMNGVKGALMGFALSLTGPIGGGIRGGWKGFLMGVGQTASMAFGSQTVAIAMGIGLSYAAGGWEGVVMFGAGIAGGLAGAAAVGDPQGQGGPRSRQNSPADPQLEGDFPYDPLKEMRLRRPGHLHRFGSTREGGSRFHAGIDLLAPVGEPVIAVDSGTVVLAQNVAGFGDTVVIQHNSVSSFYAHLKSFSPDIAIGAQIPGGSIIGFVGRSGITNALIPTHLHFGVMNYHPTLRGPIWHNPENFLRVH